MDTMAGSGTGLGRRLGGGRDDAFAIVGVLVDRIAARIESSGERLGDERLLFLDRGDGASARSCASPVRSWRSRYSCSCTRWRCRSSPAAPRSSTSRSSACGRSGRRSGRCRSFYPDRVVRFLDQPVTGVSMFMKDASTTATTPTSTSSWRSCSSAWRCWLLMRRRVFRDPAARPAARCPAGQGTGWASLLCWFGAIVTGRLIAYVGAGTGTVSLL